MSVAGVGGLVRKLKILGFPRADEPFFANWNLSCLGTLVIWLEDEKIRAFDPKDRADLRSTKAPKWLQHIHEYFESTGCPYEPPQKNTLQDWFPIIEWIVHQAVTLELKDRLKGKPAEIKEAPQQSQSSYSQSDIQDTKFAESVVALAKLLRVPSDEIHDPLVTLQCCCNIIVRKFSEASIQNAASISEQLQQITPTSIDQDKFPLGFETRDVLVNRAATLLRLMYINEMRSLQTYVNEMFEILQEFTADPKADPKLGKVGA
eukprot:TRINITY_DN3465_c0_g3_i2.p1 TRINITY_DN3465_c0_g3~~TRINITY_DN3465_c0_g3_i2.p1  ORF type:complete len:262 (-),score=54.25 TRINITY_DN3465_c0_g3_i2:258-1043(-)